MTSSAVKAGIVVINLVLVFFASPTLVIFGSRTTTIEEYGITTNRTCAWADDFLHVRKVYNNILLAFVGVGVAVLGTAYHLIYQNIRMSRKRVKTPSNHHTSDERPSTTSMVTNSNHISVTCGGAHGRDTMDDVGRIKVNHTTNVPTMSAGCRQEGDASLQRSLSDRITSTPFNNRQESKNKTAMADTISSAGKERSSSEAQTRQPKSSKPKVAKIVRVHTASRQEHKTALIGFTVTCIFLLSFIPTLTANTLVALTQSDPEQLPATWLVLHSICMRTAFLSSMSNPIVYGVMNEKFRREVSNLLK